MQAAGRYVRAADAMKLPRTGEGQVARFELVFAIIDGKFQPSSFEKSQFDPFVAMPVKPPRLVAFHIPVPEISHPWEYSPGKFLTWVQSTNQGRVANLPF